MNTIEKALKAIDNLPDDWFGTETANKEDLPKIEEI